MTRLLRASALFVAILLLLSPSPAAASRTEGLRKALADDGAVRTVYFVRGMTCRACTLLIDRQLNQEEGVYWARFNYPMRTLTVYHRPEVFTFEEAEAYIAKAGELSVTLMESGPASALRRGQGDPVALWDGGSLSVEDARRAPEPFVDILRDYQVEKGTELWYQVAYEIAGEVVRNRIIQSLARQAGYREGGPETEIPIVVAKDFYWPSDLLAPTPEEAMMADFLREEVLRKDESEVGRERFDDWLLALWKKLSLDFRGEILELAR